MHIILVNIAFAYYFCTNNTVLSILIWSLIFRLIILRRYVGYWPSIYHIKYIGWVISMRYLAGNRVFNNESWIKLNIVLVNYRSSPSAGLWMQEKDNIHPSEVIETSSSLTSNVVQNRFIKSLVKANQWNIVYRYFVNWWSP